MAKVITFGEIMLRLATPGYLRFSQAKQFEATFGGGEANVAVSLANYGIETEFVTRFPKNDIAASCIKDLHSYGVGTEHCNSTGTISGKNRYASFIGGYRPQSDGSADREIHSNC